MKILRAIPNTITGLNLLSGCVAIAMALRGATDVAIFCMFASAVFDFLDGLSARLLKAHSDIGKQLDSLADVVSFGVAPAALLHHKLLGILVDTGRINGGFCGWEIVAFFPFVVAVFSALRLAKFNIDTRQSSGFIGLPTPACALLVAALAGLSTDGHALAAWLDTPLGIISLCGILSALLVCSLPMFALKFKNLRWKDNKVAFSFLLLCLLILVAGFLLKQGVLLSVALIFGSYIFISVLLFIFSKTNNKK